MGDPDDEPTMGSYYAIDDPPPDVYDLLRQLPRPQETSRTKNKREQVERFKHRPNGEMAQDAFQQEIEQVLDSQVSPWLDVLEDEIRRRDIDV